MSGLVTATVVGGLGAVGAYGLAGASAATALGIFGAAEALGGAVHSALTTPKASSATQASGTAATQQVDKSQSTAMSARTNLLETAGGAAGSPLAPGQVGNSDKTIFGN